MQAITPKEKGRPTEYTKEKGDKICNQISTGRSLKSVIEEDETLPSLQTVYSWLRLYKHFLYNYTLATQNRTDAQLEQLNEMGDISIDEAKLADPKSANAIVQAYKLKADNVKWVMSKMKPKKYGDKLELGGDQDNPITIELVSYANKMLKAPSKVIDEENTGEE